MKMKIVLNPETIEALSQLIQILMTAEPSFLVWVIVLVVAWRVTANKK